MAAKPAKGGLGRGLGSLLASTTPTEPGSTTSAAPANAEDSGIPASRSPKANKEGGSAPAVEAPSDSLPVPGARFAYLPIASIVPNSRQPRQVFDAEALDELVHSIKEIGLLQPVVVRPIGNDRYELVAGERRLRATTAIGDDSIAAIVRTTDDAVMLRDALLENLHRADLNPLEEAAAYRQMLDDFACTQEELAQRIGRSRPQVTNTLRLLKLPPAVQKRVAAGVLSAGHARALLGLEDAAAAEALAARIVAEGLSVRAVEEIISSGSATKPRSRKPKPAASATGRSHPDFAEAAERIEAALDTRVTITYAGKPDAKRGTMVIEFADPADLHRIARLIQGPQ